jgi:hypothetical protein
MKTIAWLAALAAATGLGCQGSDRRRSSEGEQAPPAASPSGAPAPAPVPAAPPSGAARGSSKDYAGDIQKLCDVVQQSGAGSGDDRRLHIANWLAANLVTAESRQFLARIQPLVGEEKAGALEAEARRVGLPACALAAEWRAVISP